MKKLMLAIGLGLITGSAYAACIGGVALCYDDTATYVNGNKIDALGYQLPSKTKTQIDTSTPTVVGQVVLCSDCAAAGGAGTVCLSTAITGSHSFVLSTGTICK